MSAAKGKTGSISPDKRAKESNQSPTKIVKTSSNGVKTDVRDGVSKESLLQVPITPNQVDTEADNFVSLAVDSLQLDLGKYQTILNRMTFNVEKLRLRGETINTNCVYENVPTDKKIIISEAEIARMQTELKLARETHDLVNNNLEKSQTQSVDYENRYASAILRIDSLETELRESMSTIQALNAELKSSTEKHRKTNNELKIKFDNMSIEMERYKQTGAVTTLTQNGSSDVESSSSRIASLEADLRKAKACIGNMSIRLQRHGSAEDKNLDSCLSLSLSEFADQVQTGLIQVKKSHLSSRDGRTAESDKLSVVNAREYIKIALALIGLVTDATDVNHSTLSQSILTRGNQLEVVEYLLALIMSTSSSSLLQVGPFMIECKSQEMLSNTMEVIQSSLLRNVELNQVMDMARPSSSSTLTSSSSPRSVVKTIQQLDTTLLDPVAVSDLAVTPTIASPMTSSSAKRRPPPRLVKRDSAITDNVNNNNNDDDHSRAATIGVIRQSSFNDVDGGLDVDRKPPFIVSVKPTNNANAMDQQSVTFGDNNNEIRASSPHALRGRLLAAKRLAVVTPSSSSGQEVATNEWVEFIDDITKKPYYYNVMTKKTQWTVPVEETDRIQRISPTASAVVTPRSRTSSSTSTLSTSSMQDTVTSRARASTQSSNESPISSPRPSSAGAAVVRMRSYAQGTAASSARPMAAAAGWQTRPNLDG